MVFFFLVVSAQKHHREVFNLRQPLNSTFSQFEDIFFQNSVGRPCFLNLEPCWLYAKVENYGLSFVDLYGRLGFIWWTYALSF